VIFLSAQAVRAGWARAALKVFTSPRVGNRQARCRAVETSVYPESKDKRPSCLSSTKSRLTDWGAGLGESSRRSGLHRGGRISLRHGAERRRSSDFPEGKPVEAVRQLNPDQVTPIFTPADYALKLPLGRQTLVAGFCGVAVRPSASLPLADLAARSYSTVPAGQDAMARIKLPLRFYPERRSHRRHRAGCDPQMKLQARLPTRDYDALATVSCAQAKLPARTTPTAKLPRRMVRLKALLGIVPANLRTREISRFAQSGCLSSHC